MKYFAYGSNLSLARLKHRLPKAERLGMYILTNHLLKFHKASKDGSGKCDAYHTGQSHHQVIGALFEIHEHDKPILDRIEGLGHGYDQKIVAVENQLGDVAEAFTYFATHIDAACKPYSWYLHHVLIGAKEIKVPKYYLENLSSVACTEDTNLERDALERGIHSKDYITYN